ncbi:MAG TPA: bacterial transcriptional activator domain-containing protein [Candidatus Limnocylindrales bacterium]|nr:bacterial transcriptional activator domain-containing protein [Candidatus Limnocylindrales bacterium]
MIDAITRLSYESFRARVVNRKLVLLAPNTAYRGVLLGYFLRAPETGPLYYRIAAGETTVPAMITGLASEMDAVLGPDAAAFTAPLHAALKDPSAPRLAEALAASLAALNRNPAVLFLDEFDRLAINADFHTFVITLTHHLGPNAQVVINARALRAQPWYDLIARGDAVVIGAERAPETGMLSVHGAFKPQIEVFGFGGGHVLVNGQPLLRWDGALPRSLFFFFIDHPLLTRDEIFHAFWSDLGSKEATNVFHVTKRKISECISTSVEDGATYELTRYQNGYYLPSDRVTRHYDVFEFTESYQRADGAKDPREAYTLFQHVIDLHSAPFLTSIDMGWANDRRASLRQMLVHSLSSASRLAREFGDSTRALDYALRALALQSTSPELHEVAAGLALDSGRVDEARRLFGQLEALYRDAGTPLSEEGRALASRLG